MKKPCLIIIDGLIGAGKSTAAKLLHSRMKRTALIPLDEVKYYVSDAQENNTDDLIMSKKIGQAMARTYLENGFSVIVEKALTREEYVKDFTKLAKNGIRLFVYQIEAPLEVRMKRIKERPIPHYFKTQVESDKVVRNTRNYERYKYKHARVFNSEKLTPDQIVDAILSEISSSE
jgi:predicted kinase